MSTHDRTLSQFLPKLDEGTLETIAAAVPNQVVNMIGLDIVYVNGVFQDGGQGVPPNNSTLIVLNDFGVGPNRIVPPNDPTSTSHYSQQVALNFGYTNEKGFVVFVGYADGKASEFVVGDKPTETLAYTRARNEPFNSLFLQENQMLPTNAIVRRANDFFIFENGDTNDAAQIKDLTFQYQFIKDVVSQGSDPGAALPPSLLPPQTPILVGFSLPTVIPNPILFQPPEVELNVTADKSKEVAIYFVDYNDLNKDGQPDLNELPTSDEIKANLDKQSAVLPESIYGPDGGSPTAQDIETVKAKLLANPAKPSGVYAIVEKPANGDPVVLEVFPIRDSETQSKTNDEPPIVPDTKEPVILEDVPVPMPKDDTPKNDTSFVPPVLERGNSLVLGDRDANQGTSTSSRFASGGLLFGSLWLVRESSTSDKSSIASITESIEELGAVGFSRRDRRNRKLRSKLGK